MAPEIALTLMAMGLELPNIGTELSLEQALARLGIGVAIEPDAPDSESFVDSDSEALVGSAGGQKP